MCKISKEIDGTIKRQESIFLLHILSYEVITSQKRASLINKYLAHLESKESFIATMNRDLFLSLIL